MRGIIALIDKQLSSHHVAWRGLMTLAALCGPCRDSPAMAGIDDALARAIIARAIASWTAFPQRPRVQMHAALALIATTSAFEVIARGPAGIVAGSAPRKALALQLGAARLVTAAVLCVGDGEIDPNMFGTLLGLLGHLADHSNPESAECIIAALKAHLRPQDIQAGGLLQPLLVQLALPMPNFDQIQLGVFNLISKLASASLPCSREASAPPRRAARSAAAPAPGPERSVPAR